jgi:hypothetical protein
MRYDIARLVGGVNHFFVAPKSFNHRGNFNWCRAGGGAAIARALPAAETIGAVEAAPQFAAIFCGPSLASAPRVKIAARSSNSSAHTLSCSLAMLVRAPAINSRQRRAKSWSVSGFKGAPCSGAERCFENPAAGSPSSPFEPTKASVFYSSLFGCLAITIMRRMITVYEPRRRCRAILAKLEPPPPRPEPVPAPRPAGEPSMVLAKKRRQR